MAARHGGLILALAGALTTAAQTVPRCECGANPPGAPGARKSEPYAGAPQDMRPFSKFTTPYYEHYTKLVEYNGAARDVRTVPASEVDEVRIGFLGPVQDHPDQALGQRMLNGATLAIEEANAAGGYGGKPFKLMVHNDGAVWGSSSNEIVKMTYDEKVWAMLGSISGDSTHIGLRVSLRSELPMVNSAATDPTIPETIIPWYFTVIQDDRVQCYTLARRIYTDLGLKRVALLRINDRYGRFGVGKFKDASRRLGHPVVVEQKYVQGSTDFARQLEVINDSRVDAIVLWGDAAPAGQILKQMRAMGMKQRVFGSFRVMGDDLFKNAGAAADGLEFVFPYDPNRDDPMWLSFQERYKKRFGEEAEVFASLAYDQMNILLQSICRAGLNRGVIRDALTSVEHYKGVTGEMSFDPNCKNVVPLFLGTVKGGKAEYRRYPMAQPYARVGEGGAVYAGPPLPDGPGPMARIAVFGPQAEELVKTVKLPAGGRYVLVPVSSEGLWGKASTELVKALQDEDLIGFIATERNASHLAEQLSVKSLMPLIALSSDRSLTSVNIPWIFRMPPDTTLDSAVKCFVDAADKVGANRGRIRDLLSSGAVMAGAYRFDTRGELVH